MEIATVPGEARAKGNRHALKNLRNRGMLPAVVYGHGEAPETLSLAQHELLLALEQGSHVINVEVGGKSNQYLLKEVQYDHLQMHPQHVDLMRVDPDERVKLNVQLEFKGESPAQKEGGIFSANETSLEIECRLIDIPDALVVDISGLALNESLYAENITLPQGTALAGDPRQVICVMATKRGTTDEAETEEGAEGETPSEPEVIGRTAKEDDGDAGS